jgi:4'-phosphopantetheinyl transferase
MNIYWLEQTESDVPLDNEWLSASEILCLNGLRLAKRRSDWRLGRWTAKNAVAAYLHLSNQTRELADIEICPAPSGAPEVFFGSDRAPITISLSHRDGIAACAIADPKLLLGCDLEIVEPHSDAFIADYFTAEEQALFVHSDDKNLLSTLLWSAKESALKALRAGLRLDTRYVVVSANVSSREFAGWRRLQVRYTNGQIFHGWWQQSGALVRTVVADPVSPPPIWLGRAPTIEGAAQALHQESAAVLPA